MAGVNVKMGVDVSQFKQGISEAASSVKTLDAQLKLNEKQLKANGDAELYMSNKSKLLNKQLEAQRSVVSGLHKSLNEMEANGVNPSSEAYQKLERSLANAAGKMMDIQAELNGLSSSEQKAGDGAQQVAQNLSSINKKVSFDAVIGGLGKITGGLESAAKKVADLGRSIFDEIKRSAKWADDAATMAEIYEIPLDRYLRMQQLVGNGMDTTVENMLGAMDKMSTSMWKESEAAKEALRSVHLMRTETDAMGNSWEILEENDPEKLFWAFGKALQDMPEGFDKNAAATAVFGKNWREMNSLFKNYGSLEEYNEALNGLTVNSEDAVTKMADLNDRLSTLETSWNTAKLEVLSAIAPALSDAATALADLLNRVTEYLKTDKGQEKLEKMEEAVRKLFGDLSNIDPEDVVNKFAGVLDKIVTAFTWVGDHWEDVKTGLEAIGIAFGTIKIASFATNIAKVVEGFTTLWNGAHKPLPQIPGTDSGAPTGTGADAAGKTGLYAKASAAFADAAGMSLGGALAGAGITAGIIILGTSEIRRINEEAAKAREVDEDVYRFSGGIGGPMGDKRLILQDTVRRLFATTGETGGIMSAQNQMKWLSYNLNSQIMDAFSYAGGSKNKLIDMLNMDPQNAAAAYQMLRWAGFDRPGSDWSKEWRDAYETGKGSYMQIKDSGGNLGYEWALTTIRDYFGKSGVFNENGEWTIPGLEEEMAAQREAAQAMNGAVETMNTLPDKVAAAVSSAPIKVELGFGFAPKANGIWSVPWDGYPAILHKGERVTPAREIGSRSYNSNLYVESMYMNNGTDAAGLAAAMAAAQRRTMSGYGS